MGQIIVQTNLHRHHRDEGSLLYDRHQIFKSSCRSTRTIDWQNTVPLKNIQLCSESRFNKKSQKTHRRSWGHWTPRWWERFRLLICSLHSDTVFISLFAFTARRLFSLSSGPWRQGHYPCCHNSCCTAFALLVYIEQEHRACAIA